MLYRMGSEQEIVFGRPLKVPVPVLILNVQASFKKKAGQEDIEHIPANASLRAKGRLSDGQEVIICGNHSVYGESARRSLVPPTIRRCQHAISLEWTPRSIRLRKHTGPGCRRI